MAKSQSFNYLLADFFESGRYRAVQVAREAGIDPSEISKIKKGRSVGVSLARRIIGVLEPADRPRALAAWVSDQVPAEFRKLVAVEARKKSGGRLSERPPSTHTLDGALEILRGAAERDKHLRAVVMNLAKAWRGWEE